HPALVGHCLKLAAELRVVGIAAGQPQLFPFAHPVQLPDHRQELLIRLHLDDREAGLRAHIDDLADRPFNADDWFPADGHTASFFLLVLICCITVINKLSKRPIHLPKTVRSTNGLMRLERMTRPRRTAGPGPARVLVRPGEAWSHPRGTLGRCPKGSAINVP